MQNHISSPITFGHLGNSSTFQVTGWSQSEDGHTWSDGWYSSLVLSAPDAPYGFVIEIDCSPAIKAFRASYQLVKVKVNSEVINSFCVCRQGMFGLFCPPQPRTTKHLVIEFHYFKPFRPCDLNLSDDKRLLALCFRRLRILVLKEPWRLIDGVASNSRVVYSDVAGMKRQIEEITTVSFSSLCHDFEMLSGNCDLGLALREIGFEKLSLLRFGGASVGTTIKGLECDFVGIGQNIDMSIANNPSKEWMVHDKFGLLFHTGQSSLTSDKLTVEKKFQRYAEFLRTKFLEDLDEGSKIFVYADHRDSTVTRGIEDILPLYLALRRKSKARMLWVCPSKNDQDVKGSVQEILPGLAIGHLDVTAPPVLIGGGITVSGWLTVLCNAWLIFNKNAQ